MYFLLMTKKYVKSKLHCTVPNSCLYGHTYARPNLVYGNNVICFPSYLYATPYLIVVPAKLT